MKKFLSVFFAVVLFAGLLNAAPGDKSLGVGLNIALPTGSFGDVAGTGIGGTAVFELELAPQIVGTGTAGYISWGGKDFGGFSYSYSAIPILVGVKYFFMPTGGFYANGQIGLYLFSWNADVPSVSVFGVSYGGNVSYSSTEFALALGGGYEIPVSPKLTADISASYLIISNLGHIGIRGGIKFGI
jgi:opacity protein-like surface antigen